MVTLKAHILPHPDLQPPGCRGSAPAGESAVRRGAQLTGVRSAVGSVTPPQLRRSLRPCSSRRRSAAVVRPSANIKEVVGAKAPPLKSFTSPPPQPCCVFLRTLPVRASVNPSPPRIKLRGVRGLSIKTGQAVRGG